MTHRKLSWTKYWCRLHKARMECWDSEEESKDPEGKAKNVIKLNQVRCCVNTKTTIACSSTTCACCALLYLREEESALVTGQWKPGIRNLP